MGTYGGCIRELKNFVISCGTLYHFCKTTQKRCEMRKSYNLKNGDYRCCAAQQ